MSRAGHVGKRAARIRPLPQFCVTRGDRACGLLGVRAVPKASFWCDALGVALHRLGSDRAFHHVGTAHVDDLDLCTCLMQ